MHVGRDDELAVFLLLIELFTCFGFRCSAVFNDTSLVRGSLAYKLNYRSGIGNVKLSFDLSK